MGRLGGSTSTFGYGRCNLSMAQKFVFARLLHSIGTDNNTLKRYLDFKMHANAKGKKSIQINAFICRRVVWNDEKMESIARINRFSIKHIFTVLWIIQSFFVPSVWCCNEKKKKNSATVPRLSTTRFIRECTNVLLSIFRKSVSFSFFYLLWQITLLNVQWMSWSWKWMSRCILSQVLMTWVINLLRRQYSRNFV